MKKRILCLIAIILLIMSFRIVSFGDDKQFSLDVSDGEDGSVNVSVSYHGEKKPVAVQFAIEYDAEKLECVETASGDAISGMTAPIINETDGKIYFVWDSLNASQEGTFLNIKFKEKAETASGAEVGIDTNENFIFVDESYSPIVSSKDVPGKIVIGKDAEDGSGSSGSGTTQESGTQEKPSEKENHGETSEAETDKGETSEPDPKQEETKQPESEKEETGFNKGISMEKNKAEMTSGERQTLTVTDLDDAEEKLVWSSSNEGVATVDENGEIVAVAPGKTIITVMSEDGEKESTCVVTVTEDNVDESGINEDIVNENDPVKAEREKKPVIWVPFVIGGIVIVGALAFLLFKKRHR